MLTFILLFLASGLPSPAPAAKPVTVCETSWTDTSRGRTVPLRIRMPAGTARVPLILFSHGLGGSLDAGTTWGEYWSANGFAVIHMQHPGSDRGILTGGGGIAAMRGAMGATQLIDRTRDASFVLDELPKRTVPGCDLSRIDLSRVGMSGHSFGAVTTQALAGETFRGGLSLGEPRIKAAIAFSPSPPTGAGEDATRRAFASIAIPFLSITGTEDAVPELTTVTQEQRAWPFRFMPAGGKYLLVFKGGKHSDFAGGSWRPAQKKTDAHIVDAIDQATLAFWKASLMGEARSRRWLDRAGIKPSLGEGDRFETK
jgi:predicted dienelactone hydrolase